MVTTREKPSQVDDAHTRNAEIRFMGIKAMPLVFTSINPHGSLDWQLKCYKSFRASGHQIISTNHSSEIELLNKHCPAVATVELRDSEVATERYGKPLGKIINILKKLRDYDTRDYYALVNSDILFTGRKACIGQFLKHSAAAALTRTDIPREDCETNTSGLPYRGGLDIFLFSRQGLEETINHLEKHPSICDEMAIGIPGWDYMVGGTILSHVKGSLMDSENIFQHAIHKQTYSDLSAFKTIASVLCKQGLVESNEPNAAAAQFVEKISIECTQNTQHARRVATVYRKFKTNRSGESTYVNQKLDENTTKALLQLYYQRDLMPIRKLINRISKDGATEFLGVKITFIKGNSFTLKVSQLITCASCIFQCMPNTGPFTAKYPAGNSHKACLDLIARLENKEERDFHLTDLFYTELLQHKIFNADIFCYLLSIQKDRLLVNLLKDQHTTILTSLT
jgi:hypothetical protein